MPRLILTFKTMFDVLAADKLLKEKFVCRPTPTPPGLSTSICGMSLELLSPEDQDAVVETLKTGQLSPSGIHQID